MAIYHLTVKTGSRSTGSSAAAKARYLQREGPYADRKDLLYCTSGHLPSWASSSPTSYWAAADTYERANGRLFKEVEFALPVELPEAEQRTLAFAFAAHLTEGERLPYTLAIHAGGGTNPHCHLMMSERINDGVARPAEQWFKRANPQSPERGGAKKSTSLKPKTWLETTRATWQTYANQALERGGHAARIDHRTLAAQGIARVPQVHLGPNVVQMEKQGRPTRLHQESQEIAETNAGTPPPERGKVPDRQTLWEAYQAHQRDGWKSYRAGRREGERAWRKFCAERRADLRTDHAKIRAAAWQDRRALAPGHRPPADVVRSLLAFEYAQSRERLTAELARERQTQLQEWARQRQGLRRQTWPRWLQEEAEQGNELAVRAQSRLRSRAPSLHPGAPPPVPAPPPAPQGLSELTAHVAGRTVIYTDRNGLGVMQDRGARIEVWRADAAASEAALQLAAAKWGKVALTGSPAWVEATAQQAARLGIEIVGAGREAWEATVEQKKASAQEREAEQARQAQAQAQARQEALVAAVTQSNVKEMQRLVAAGADLRHRDEQGQTLLHVAALSDASPAMTSALIAHGIEVNARASKGETALHLAASRSTQAAVLEAYLAAGADRQAECQGWRPVEVAAGYTREAAVLEVLVQDEDPDGHDGKRQTLLHYAAKNPHPAAAQMLLQRGWDPEARDQQGQTPAEIAQAQGHTETAAVLAAAVQKKVADRDAKAFGHAVSDLVNAVQFGEPKEAQTLLEAADSPLRRVQPALDWNKIRDFHDDSTLLHLAAARSTASPEMIQVLAPLVDVDSRNHEGETPLDVAASRSSSPAVVQALLALGAPDPAQNSEEKTLLHHAARNPHPAVAQALLAQGWDPEARDEEGRTPAEIAQAQGHAETAAVLAEAVQAKQEAEQVRQAQARQEALVEAVKQSNVKEMQRLVEAGADPRHLEEQGQTLLHVAALSDASPAMTSALIAHGIEVNARASKGETALHLAASRSTQAAVLEAYLAAGADRQAECQGWRPVEVAAGYTRQAAVLEVLVQGEDLDGRDGQGRTLLHHAARNPNPAAAQVLRKDWDLAARDGQGQTPLEIAQAQGNSKTAAMLTKGILQQELRATRARVAGLASLFAKLEALWSQGVTKIQNYRKEAQVQAEREAADLARQEVVAAPPAPPPAPEVPAEPPVEIAPAPPPPVEHPAAADVDPVQAITDWARACSEQCGQLQDEKRRTRLQKLDTDLRLTRDRLIDLEQSPPGFFQRKVWQQSKDDLLSQRKEWERERDQVARGQLDEKELKALEQQAQEKTEADRLDLLQAVRVGWKPVATACQRVKEGLADSADRDFLLELKEDVTDALQSIVDSEATQSQARCANAFNEFKKEYAAHRNHEPKDKAWQAKERHMSARGKAFEKEEEKINKRKQFKAPGQAGAKAVQERLQQLVPFLLDACKEIRKQERDQKHQTLKATQHKSQGQGHKL